MATCVCGEELASAVSPEEIVTQNGVTLRFRRRTDYVMCGRCLRFYRVNDLRGGRVRPLTFAELGRAEDVQVEGASGG